MTDSQWSFKRPKLEPTERTEPGLDDVPWGTQPRPNVQEQLAKRRKSGLAAWRRDALREAALLVLLVVLVAVLYVVAVAAKDREFRASGEEDSATFWMESAQRFRYVRMVADGNFIPTLDQQMEAPDGYPPWSDTVLQEVFYGDLYRRLAGPETDLATFVRYVTRLFSASAVFPVMLLVFALTRRRDAALLAGLAYGTCLAVTERGTGAGILREDLAVPILYWHLAMLAFWSRRPKLPTALLAGVFLALALLLWKVVHFYVLLLVVFLASAHWLDRERTGPVLEGALGLLVPSLCAALLPFSLSYDGFLTSTPVLAGAGMLSGLVGAQLFRKSPMPFWVGLSLAAFVALRLLLPREVGYDHAWETILARLRFALEKPADPSLLSFHARHYWTGNYESPTVSLLLRCWPALGLAAAPGLWVAVRGWSKRRFERLEGDLDAAVPVRLLDGLGPAQPLAPLASHFFLWLMLSFTGSYLVFRKLQLFAAMALSVAVAMGFASVRGSRDRMRLALVVLVLVSAAQGWRAVPTADGWFAEDSEDVWNPVEVFSPQSFNGLVDYLATATKPGETILASFVISPFFLAYLERSTVLHCFFEGRLLDRFRDVVEARFSDEEELWNLSRRTGADWYVHEAHHLLRTDGRMSQRYVADQVDWPPKSVVTQMHFSPEELQHFELRFQNQWFRVFRVLAPGEKPQPLVADVGPVVWNRRLFTHLFGDPRTKAPAAGVTGEREPADLLYATLQAERWVTRAQKLVDGSEPGGRDWAERYLQEARRIAPYFYAADEGLSDLYLRAQKEGRAAVHRERAQLVRGALAGQHPFPADIGPESPLKP
ncbi:MAG: hypothetical protein CL928_02335 [Deltaproteobacteria bacterium]|nr:hypothetical protein [Deltaproteobacteria bacterium]